jgi:hypothetical protein
MCISKKTWRKLGSPSFKKTVDSDAGQHITRVAEQMGCAVRLSMPTGCLKPVWNLSDIGLYGIGTFYQSGLFHLFQARKQRNTKMFLEVSRLVLAGQRIDPMQLQKKYNRWLGFF